MSLWLAISLLSALAARPTQGFAFTFPGQADAGLGQCGSLDLVLDGESGEGPYSFLIYEAGSVPKVQAVQDGGRGSLSDVTVQARAGSQVILTMLDSAGEAGGLSAVYNVEESSSGASCMPNSQPAFQASYLPSDELETCADLLIQWDSSDGPFQVQITSATAGSPTNVQVESGFNAYSWVNRAPPGSQIIVSVSDASGGYALSSKLITTAGSSDTTCRGRQSESLNMRNDDFQKSATQVATTSSTSRSSVAATSSADSSSSTPARSSSASMSSTVDSPTSQSISSSSSALPALPLAPNTTQVSSQLSSSASDQPASSTSVSNNTQEENKPSSSNATVAGATIGSALGVVILAFVFSCWRRNRKQGSDSSSRASMMSDKGYPLEEKSSHTGSYLNSPMQAPTYPRSELTYPSTQSSSSASECGSSHPTWLQTSNNRTTFTSSVRSEGLDSAYDPSLGHATTQGRVSNLGMPSPGTGHWV